jgi:cell division protein ZipA
MDSDTLRIILLGLGVVLILGIYLWDRRRSGKSGSGHRRAAKQEPTLGPVGENIEQAQPSREGRDLTPEEEFADLPPLHLEHPDSKPFETEAKPHKGFFGWGKSKAPQEEEPPDAARASEAGEPYHPPGSGVPHLILQINVAAKQGRFEGDAIAAAAARAGLEQGAMNIFHRYDQPGVPHRVLFSMASMVEPGTFPFDAMDHFATPGLSLFAQLPGPRDGQFVYDTMLASARKLAEQLDGELRDETHSVLSRQTIEHVRFGIAEHRRHLAIAKKHP